jgi:hypothetical protein
MDELRDALDNSETNGWYKTRRLRLDGSVVAVEAAGLPIDWDGEQAQLIMNRDISSRS